MKFEEAIPHIRNGEKVQYLEFFDCWLDLDFKGNFTMDSLLTLKFRLKPKKKIKKYYAVYFYKYEEKLKISEGKYKSPEEAAKCIFNSKVISLFINDEFCEEVEE